MSLRGRVLLGASAAGVLLVGYMLFHLASAPTYTMLSAGIDPAQTSKLTTALDAQGITYRLANNGTALEVEAGQAAKARVALAGQGLGAGGAGDAWAPLDKQKLGASEFQQQIAYQRALEGQIAQTVNQISGVGGASVQLTLPKDQLFADQQTPATAAVLLSGGASSLEAGSVRGIANLVASSVQGLKTSNVTITDGTGQLLWPTGESAGSTASKPAAQARYNAALAAQLDAIVGRTVGPGKASVQVQSDLNVDTTSLDKLAYAKKGIPLKATSETESLKGNGSGSGGVAGTGSNIPSYAAAGGGAGGKSNYTHKTRATDFGVGRVVTHTKVAPGTVNKLDVALVVDPSVPAAVRGQLQRAVATAAGIQPTRGDTISTSVVPFAKQTLTKASPVAGLAGYVKYALLGLASRFFLFFVGRHLRRREEADLLGEPVWLRQIDSPRSLAELTAAGDEPVESLLTAGPAVRRQVEDAVNREPERVAQTLRAWMEERP
jgi:flagellar M-ring protein FliF